MAKGKKRKNSTKSIPKSTLPLIEKNRTGGSISLTGFDYQCLYSCYTLLTHLTSQIESVRFEGIEDIDSYVFDGIEKTKHIQVKYSTQKQDSSFLKSIFKNYLEVYLCDPNNSNRNFVLIYDFIIADGHFKRLVERDCKKEFDDKETKYWTTVIEKIRSETPHWNWDGFNLNDFMSKVAFEHIEYQSLLDIIKNLLIENYAIHTGNELLYAHSLYFYCFSKMRVRGKTNKKDLDSYILEITDEINKGAINPAIHWINPIDFENIPPTSDNMYFEGKKAVPADIVAGLPVPRPNLENKIRQSIAENKITVIKASSGQGKTTLAWRVAYEERSHYSIYQIVWCMDRKELDYIVEYIQSRIKVGEIPLIVFDNLDAQLKEWNKLAQLLETKIGSNYRLLITTRESDWYTYSGDQSNIRNLKIHNVVLDNHQAQEIFSAFSAKGKIHTNIVNWQSAWEQIDKTGLLIEYVYLLTHGEMLAERIAAQMKEIEQQSDKDLMFDVLRKICFADVLGIRLASDKLCAYYEQKSKRDITSILNGFKNEYLLAIDEGTVYISGLHPVRSQHLLNVVHKFSSKTNTILELLDIIDKVFVSKLYSNIPQHISKADREDFYNRLTSETADNSYQYYLDALKGIYSGSVYNYYLKNKIIFDDANHHGGLEIFLMDINPYSKFDKFDTEVQTIAEMHKTLPDDDNIAYLKSIVDSIEKFNIKDSDYYFYAYYLYKNIFIDHQIKADTEGFSSLVYWLVNVDTRFNVLSTEIIDYFWNMRKTISVQFLSELMLSWYLGSEDEYTHYVLNNKNDILSYLKIATQSMRLFENRDNNSILVEYLLLPSEVQSGSKKSVERLSIVCKFLPIYDYYCADSIRPQSDFLDSLKTPDDSHKQMPKRNIIIMFHQEYANLWSNTILSNYEAATVFEWLEFWVTTRQKILRLCRKTLFIIDKLLNQKKISQATYSEFDELRDEITLRLRQTYPYPRQNRPFEKSQIPQEASLIINKYFSPIKVYFQQVVGLLLRKENESRLAIINLRTAKIELNEMQGLFQAISEKAGYYLEEHIELDKEETQIIEKLLVYNQYYSKHPTSRIATPVNVDNWNQREKENLRLEVEKLIINNKLCSMSFEYPKERLDNGVLYTLPLIAEDMDLNNNDVATGLILTLLPLATLEIDFIVVIFKSNQEDIVKPAGIRFSKDFLVNAQKVVESNDDSHLANSYSPLPIEIMDDMLDVFVTEYSIASAEPSEQYDIIFENIWKYAQLKKYIEDPDYLKEMQDVTRKEINAIFKSLSTSLPALHDYTENAMRSVLENEQDFNNDDFNDAFNKIIYEANSKQ